MRIRIVLTIGVLSMLGATLGAQERGTAGGPARLLWVERVQKELGLTDDQITEAKAISPEIQEKYAKDIQNVNQLKGAERQEKGKKLRDQIAKDVNASLANVLKPAQVKRLKQINLQVLGVQAFVDPSVQKALNLTNDQKADLKKLAESTGKQVRTSLDEGRGDYEAIGKRIEGARKEAMDQAMAQLSAKQRQAWQKLTGEPFDIKLDELFIQR